MDDETDAIMARHQLSMDRGASMSVDQILALPGGDAWEAMAHFGLNKYFSAPDDWAAQPPGLHYFYDAWCLQGDVDNGGLFQWFENLVWHAERPAEPATVANGLRALGAIEQAAIVDRAAVLLPPLHQCSLDEEIDVPPEVDAEIEELQARFYELPQLYEYMERFLREHPEAFRA